MHETPTGTPGKFHIKDEGESPKSLQSRQKKKKKRRQKEKTDSLQRTKHQTGFYPLTGNNDARRQWTNHLESLPLLLQNDPHNQVG